MTDKIEQRAREHAEICVTELTQKIAERGYLAGYKAALESDEVKRLVEALKWYASIGDDDDSKLEERLERAMDDRPKDRVTINLGGKYVAKIAREALAEWERMGR